MVFPLRLQPNYSVEAQLLAEKRERKLERDRIREQRRRRALPPEGIARQIPIGRLCAAGSGESSAQRRPHAIAEISQVADDKASST